MIFYASDDALRWVNGLLKFSIDTTAHFHCIAPSSGGSIFEILAAFALAKECRQKLPYHIILVLTLM